LSRAAAEIYYNYPRENFRWYISAVDDFDLAVVEFIRIFAGTFRLPREMFCIALCLAFLIALCQWLLIAVRTAGSPTEFSGQRSLEKSGDLAVKRQIYSGAIVSAVNSPASARLVSAHLRRQIFVSDDVRYFSGGRCRIFRRAEQRVLAFS
jgi:hypothetical protein